MRIARLVVLCLASATAAGQGQLTEAFDLRHLAGWGDRPPESQRVDPRIHRLAELAITAFFGESGQGTAEWFQAVDQLMVKGPAVQVIALRATSTEINRGMTRPMHVQFSLIRMPADVAARHGLVDAKHQIMREAEVALVLRDVQSVHGTLVHLSEIRTGSLEAFELPVPQRFATVAAGVTQPRLVVHGEALPIGDGAAFHVDIAEMPDGKAAIQPPPLLATTMFVGVGQGAVFTKIQGEQATVLWLRLVSMEPAEARSQARK